MQYTSKEVYEFISKQTNDPIVERKPCSISGQPFAIFQSDLDFYNKISPSFAGQKFQIPTPTFCPEERQRRRLSFRNERKLYRRQCDASKKSIVSIYSPDKPYKVYDQKVRRSDTWNPMDYAIDFNFNKTFTENFKSLLIKVPRANFYGTNNENSDYTNHCNYSKDCYLCADLVRSESCLYSNTSIDSINTVDCNLVTNSKHVYESSYSDNIYNSQYIINSSDCKDSSLLVNCKNCEYCFGCSNLQNKKYHIFNKAYSEKDYFNEKEKVRTSYLNIGTLKEIIQSSIQNQLTIHNSEKCYGDNIQNSKESILNFSLYDSQSIKYSHTSGWFSDSYDCLETGLNCSLLYECHAVMESYKSSFISISYNNNTSYYLDNCYNNSNLFGCIGLRNKQYCIFNKQYTKEEYEITVAKIIAHMQQTGERGEFFHPSLSPFGYNETVAQEYFPIGRDMLLACPQHGHMANTSLQQFGYHRSDYNADPSIPEGIQTVERKNYSDEQRSQLLSQDNLETQVFICSISARPYRLQKAEIEFYRKHHLPIPDKHPDVRHEERMKLRPGRTLYLRKCDCCEKEMLSVYAAPTSFLPPSGGGGPQDNSQGQEPSPVKGRVAQPGGAKELGGTKVYCESCYQQETYS